VSEPLIIVGNGMAAARLVDETRWHQHGIGRIVTCKDASQGRLFL
jgi:hypothetical protein